MERMALLPPSFPCGTAGRPCSAMPHRRPASTCGAAPRPIGDLHRTSRPHPTDRLRHSTTHSAAVDAGLAPGSSSRSIPRPLTAGAILWRPCTRTTPAPPGDGVQHQPTDQQPGQGDHRHRHDQRHRGHRRLPRGASAGRPASSNPRHAAHLLVTITAGHAGRVGLGGSAQQPGRAPSLPTLAPRSLSCRPPRSGQHRADHHGGQRVHARSTSSARDVLPSSGWVLPATPG
jgi:hypothetical protein